MPLPSANDVHVDGLRTELSIAYLQDKGGFVADRCFPIVKVDKQSDKYAVWSKADFMRRQMRQVADGAPSPELSYAVDTTPTYFCDTYGGKKLLTDRQRANYDSPLMADRTVVNFLTQQALIERDYQFSLVAWTTGVWGTDSTPATTWEGGAGDPIGDIRTGINSVRTACGNDANTLVLGNDVWDELRDHGDITDRIKYTQTGVVTEDLLAQIFGLKQVIVAKGTYNTASAGATASMSDIFDPDDALLLYVADSPSHDTPSAGYTFSWSEFDIPNLASSGAAAIKTWRSDDPDGEWFRALMSFDPVVTASDAGYFFRTAVA